MIRSDLIHIRHGQTDWNAAGRLQGSKDVPLNDIGRGQAHRNGATLARHLAEIDRRPDEFVYVASPLGRARATMEIVRSELGLDPTRYHIEPALTEVSFGDYEGYTYEDIRAIDPVSYAAIRADKWNYLPPAGESYEMLRARVGRWLGAAPDDLIVVSHGGVYRVIKALMLGIHDPHLAEILVPQDQISVWRNGAESWI